MAQHVSDRSPELLAATGVYRCARAQPAAASGRERSSNTLAGPARLRAPELLRERIVAELDDLEGETLGHLLSLYFDESLGRCP